MWVQKLTIQKFVEVQVKKQFDTLIMERPLTLTIPDHTQLKTTYTPSKEKELAVGYALAHGIIQNITQVKSVKIEPGEITLIAEPTTPIEAAEHTPINLNLLHVYELTASFQENALLFKDTAISESAAITQANKIVAFAEDLHQNNALYKAVGTAVLQDVDLTKCGILTSGKIDEAFIKKIIPLGISVVISRTAPTTSTLALAQEHNILLVGFARGRKCNVYTFPSRIIR